MKRRFLQSFFQIEMNIAFQKLDLWIDTNEYICRD